MNAATAAAVSHDITAAGQEQKQTWCYRGLTEKLNCAKPVTPKFSVCWLKVQAIFSSFSWEGEEMGAWGAADRGVMPKKASLEFHKLSQSCIYNERPDEN